MPNSPLDHGPQPLDSLMERWALGNHRLVEDSPDQLTHKQVQRARKGRQLTLHMMQKIARAFNESAARLVPGELRADFRPYPHRQLFNYAKGHDPAWADPNEALIPPR